MFPVPGPDRFAGMRFIRLIEDQLRLLRRDRDHPNRTVFFQHVVIAHLLAFFNGSVESLRKVEDIFESQRMRERFGAPRLPKSTLSDAQRVFDPTLLLSLIESLKRRVGVSPHDPRLDEITRKLMAFDGSFFAVAPRVTWALYNQTTRTDTDRPIRKGQVKGHFHFDIIRGIPDRVTLTDGQASETEQLRQSLVSGCLYIYDRGIQQYQLLLDIIQAGSDFVGRFRKSACMEAVESRPLTSEDVQAGVLSDTLVRVGWREDQTPLAEPLRCVKIAQSDKPDDPIILLTNRSDLPAWLIGLLYRHRWQIELFFRWLKCFAGFGHFFSESKNGMTIQIYVAIIATLLIAVETGSKPSSYDYNLMAAAVADLMSMEEALRIAARRRRERQRAAQRARAKAAQKAKA